MAFRLAELLSFYVSGLPVSKPTLAQHIPLASSLITSFKFEEINRETIEGRETLVIKFQQTTVNSNINFKINAPDYFEISHTFYRGTIWLDLKNHRILRLITELTAKSARFIEPFVTLRQGRFGTKFLLK